MWGPSLIYEWRGLTVVHVSKQGCVSITCWQHLTWHFMTPARHTKSFSFYYFKYFRHVAMLQKFAGPLVGRLLWGHLFGWTCWTCLNPPLYVEAFKVRAYYRKTCDYRCDYRDAFTGGEGRGEYKYENMSGTYCSDIVTATLLSMHELDYSYKYCSSFPVVTPPPLLPLLLPVPAEQCLNASMYFTIDAMA